MEESKTSIDLPSMVTKEVYDTLKNDRDAIFQDRARLKDSIYRKDKELTDAIIEMTDQNEGHLDTLIELCEYLGHDLPEKEVTLTVLLPLGARVGVLHDQDGNRLDYEEDY